MTSFSTRNRTRSRIDFGRRERWSRKGLLATTGLGGALAGLALGGGNAWGQVGPNTLPTGGQVVAGSANINQPNHNTLDINQSTNRAVINWSSFDVGKDSTVNFHQPNSGSWTVNRVTAGQSASQILGSVNANGNIAVINPNGVIFGQGSRVDVNGLIATTSNISNQNFMSGNMNFDQPGNPNAMVVNQGDITVRDAGLVAFVAPGVSNAGTITANLGRVSLASGNKFTVDLYGDKLISIAVDGGTSAAPAGADALVSNSGQIVADGGRVQMTAAQASAIVDNAINMSGVVRAQSAYVDRNGDIVLDGGAGNVTVSGTLDVSGQGAGQKGGSVTVTTKGDVNIASTARISASGSAGGGTVKVGGDWQGKGATPTARNTTVAKGAKIDASATDNGDGGRVVVWADNTTLYSGDIVARGGANGGNGGMVEVSGKQILGFAGFVDTRAPQGLTGTLLLDPTTVDIVDGADDEVVTGGTITDGTIEALLATTDVTIQASAAGTGTGDGIITVHSGVSIDFDGSTLVLIANDDTAANIANGTITIQSGVTFTDGSLELQAGTVNLGSSLGVSVINAGATAPTLVNVTSTTVNLDQALDILSTDGGTITLVAGVYTRDEAWVIDVADVTIEGAQAGVSATSGRSFAGVAESTLDFTDTTHGVVIAASGITLDGFSIRMATAGMTAVFIDDATASIGAPNIFNNYISGVAGSWNGTGIGNGGVNGLTGVASLVGNRIDGFSSSGIDLTEINDLVVDDLYLDGSTGTTYGVHVLFANDVTVTNATITGTAHRGIEAAVGSDLVLSNILFPVSATGIHGAIYVGQFDDSVDISNVMALSGGSGEGMAVNSSSNVTISNSSISGFAAEGMHLGTFGGVNIVSGNRIDSVETGIYVVDATGSDTVVTLSGNSISGVSNAGIQVGSSLNNTALIDLTGDIANTIDSGSNPGIVINGSGTGGLVNNSLGNTVFITSGLEDASSKYVVLQTGAHAGTVINGLHATFDGVSGSKDAATIAQIEAKIIDDETATTVGDVFVAGAVTLTAAGGGAGIQQAADLYGDFEFAGDIYLTGGTYAFADDGLQLWGAGVTVQALDAVGSPVTLTFDSGVSVGVQIGAEDVTVRDLNLVHDGSGVIMLISAGGANAVVEGNTLTGNVLASDPAGIRISGAGNTSILGNTLVGNGMAGDGIEVWSPDTITNIMIDGNTITDFNGHGIYIDPVINQTVVNNTILGVGSDGIFVDTPIGNVILQNNLIDDTGGAGIRILDATGVVGDTINISGNRIGTSVDLIGSDGIVLDDNYGFEGATSIVGNTIVVGANGASGIYIGAHRSAIISDNAVSNSGSADYGLLIVGTSIANTTFTISATSTTGNVFDSFDQAGIRIEDADAYDATVATLVFFNGPNTIAIGTGAAGLQVDGPATRIGNSIPTRTLGAMTFLRTQDTDNFIELSNGALFTGLPFPTQPAIISAGDALFDIDADGTISGVELELADFNPANITTQDQLDDFWDPDGIADSLIAIESSIIDYKDDATLGQISVLGAPVTILDNPSGGLEAVQAAIDATPTGGYVFINSGVYGAPSPGGAATDDPLIIDRSMTVYGRQAFVSANDPGRTAGGADETVFDFSVQNLDPSLAVVTTGAVVIDANQVTLRGVDIVADGFDEGFGVRIDGADRTNIVIANNFIRGVAELSPLDGDGILSTGSLQSATITGNQIYNITGSGIRLTISAGAETFTLQGNAIRAGSDSSSSGIVLTALGNATTLSLTENTIGNAGNDGIQVNNFNVAVIEDNVIDSSAPDSAIGRDAIRVSGGSGGSAVSGNTIGGSSGFAVGGNGINLVGPTGSFDVEDNEITNVGATVADTAGIRIQAISGTPVVNVANNTIRTVSGTGADGISVVNASSSNITVTLTGNTIEDVTDAGVSVVDTSAINTGLTTVVFASGNVVDDAARGLFFSGPDTRSQDSLGNRTFNDLVLGSAADSISGNFIELQNAALHGNPNGTPFTPLTYDASGVTFNGLDVTTLDPTNLADRQQLADLEERIVHYLDTTLADYNASPVRNMRGLIRLKTDSFSLDDSSGLNAIQLAISASNDGDTIYLVAGSYGDASDLLDTINDYLQGETIGTPGNDYLYIDRPLTIIGVNDGVPAPDGTRQPFNAANESVLDFVAATESNDGGVVIAASNVTIDGVAILADEDQPFGIRIDTTDGALSNIDIVNNFVLGASTASVIDGNGIETFGSNSVSNLNISDNAIDLVDADAVHLVFVRGLTIQNNLVGSSSATLSTVADDGFDLTNVTYAASVSGNSIFATGDDGMVLDNDALDPDDAANAVSIVGNTVAGTGGDGIQTSYFGTVTIQSNTIGLPGFGTGAQGIFVHDTSGLVTVGGSSTTGNTVDATGLNGIHVFWTGVSQGPGGVVVSHNQIGQNDSIGITSQGGNAIDVNMTSNGNVTVADNLIGSANGSIMNGSLYDGDGIRIANTFVGHVSVLGNSVQNAGDDGITVFSTGLTVLVSDNDVANVGWGTQAGDGILVSNTGTADGDLDGDVTVVGNTIVGVTGSGFGSDDGKGRGDGIRVSNVDGNVIVGNDGNTIVDADDDGIEVNGVAGNVSVSNNTITNVSNSTATGDGIVITSVGDAYYGSGNSGVTVYVYNNTITNVGGDGSADTLTDGLSGGDGIRVSNVDGSITVLDNILTSIGNDGIQAYDINNTVLIEGNQLDTISDNSDTGDGIVVENTGRRAASGGVAAGGSVTVVSNVVSNVGGAADRDDDVISAGTTQGLSSGDGIRVAGIDGAVLIGGESGTGNTVTNVAGDGIQVYYVSGEDGGTNNGVSIGYNVVTTAGLGGGDDGDGIQIGLTGRYGGSTADFTGDVAVFNNTVNDVIASAGADRDDGFTSGDGIRIVQTDGHVTVSANLVGAGADATIGDGIANDGIQISVVTRSVLVSGNTVGSNDASIGTNSDDGDGIVIENTGTLSGAAHAVDGEGAVVVTSNTVMNVLGTGVADTDGAAVTLGGTSENDIFEYLSAGDGIRVAFVNGDVTVGGSSTDGNTVTNVGDDGIQVYAVDGIGGTPGGAAVLISYNLVDQVGDLSGKGDGIVVSYTGMFVSEAGSISTGTDGLVRILDNTIDNVNGDAADSDDDRSAGDGIRVRSADTGVEIAGNSIATQSLSAIANDGIQVWDVKGSVTVGSNTVGTGSGATIGTGASGDGDGIVVENVGRGFSTRGSGLGVGNVYVTGNIVANIGGDANADADGAVSDYVALYSGADPVQYLSAGDGIRVAFVGDQVTISGNSVTNTANDGIQAYMVRGAQDDDSTAVSILNNVIGDVGNATVSGQQDGDGIAVAFTGNFVAGGLTLGGGVLIQGNTVDDVTADEQFDRDDGRTAGDGVRVRSADGAVTVTGNSIGTAADIANDGVQIADVTRIVTVTLNTIGSDTTSIGNMTADGDGIVVEDTGQYATPGTTLSPTAGLAGVTIADNTITNVRGNGSFDRDGPVAAFSAGDGIRATRIDGPVTVDANSIDTVGDDGIQLDTVAGSVTITNNDIEDAGLVSITGDGIVISDVGNAYDGGIGPSGVSVVVADNSVTSVAGNGLADPDDAQHSNGDGVRIVRVDGSVQALRNTIGLVADDGIYIGVVRGDVSVVDNRIETVGVSSDTGDGIVVAVTGTFAGGTLGAGDVTILNNTIFSVNADAPSSPDFDDPNGYYTGTGQGLSAGDGIRAEAIDGDLVIGNSSATGNSIVNTDDDGIQVRTVQGNVTVLYNRIATVGVDGNRGDGITVADVGLDFTTGGPSGVTVTVSNNTITNVNGDGLADPDDSYHSNGDGIRIVRVDGSAQADANSIAGVDDDGIYIGVIRQSVMVRGNVLDDMGRDSDTGDGIVVAVTGSYAGGVDGAGSVTIENNTVTNVSAANPAAPDFDDPFFNGKNNEGYSAGDGIRAENIDGDLIVGSGPTTGNSISGVDDDGIQIQTVRGNVTVLYNVIDNVGRGTDTNDGLGDGIVVADVGAAYASGSVSGVLVNVSNNTISNVDGDGQSDPDDSNHGNGDGIRIVRVDGSAQANANSIADVDDDGIYVGVVRGTVNVRNNALSNMGLDSDTADGIVVALTGAFAGGADGAGDVTINGNTIVNVTTAASGAPADFDDPNGTYFGTGNGLSSGDGIRAENIDGDVVVGESSVTGNSIQGVDDDGIQIQTVRGNVTALFNRIDTVGRGNGSNDGLGDGITVADIGAAYASGSVSGVLVNVSNNTIANVDGDGQADPDDSNHSNGDGIRIVRVDGSAQANANSIANVDDDGIYVGVVRGTVNVRNNALSNMGLDSDTADGIVVALTGVFAGGADGAGDVTINGNTIVNVTTAASGAPADFDDPNGAYFGTGNGLSSGDGIRAENIDGDLVVGESSVTGNSIQGVDDDGIQIQTVRGNVSALFNRIDTVGRGNGSNDGMGDGITVADIGAAYAGGSVSGVLVNVSNNTIANVDGDGQADADDPDHSNGDGIRIVRVDGNAQANANSIANVDDDGIYVGVVRGTVNVRNNALSNMGLDSDTADGIVVALTGEYADGTADGGSVTINGNTVVNVDMAAPGALDFDNPNAAYGATGTGLSAGDGIRVEFADGNVVVGQSGAGNSIQNVDGDGIQVYSVTGATTITFNNILDVANDGTNSDSGDGIQVNFTGQYASLGYGAIGAGDVVVSNNTIVNVQNSAGNLPDQSDVEDGQTSGDGIRLHQISGDVTVNSNLIDPIGDDGIQIGNVDFTVTSNNNTITDIGVSTDFGDGIVIFNTGMAAGDGNGSVTVNGNTIVNIGGTGTGGADPDDGGYTSNDGIRIVLVDGSVAVGSNSIANTRDDGVQIFDVRNGVNVTNNTIQTVGAGSLRGDGIVVHGTGGNAVNPGTTGSGNVTVSGNTVTSVTGDGSFDTDDGVTAGDGVRVTEIDGHIVILSNVIQTVGDDGIQAYSVSGGATVTGNQVSVAGNGSTTGDGIVIESLGSGSATVVVSQNTIADVRGNGDVANVDDAGSPTTENDGIRIQDVAALTITVQSNQISLIGDDGIEVAFVDADVIVGGNTLATIGTGSGGLGDGIIVTDISGSANVSANAISSVLSANAGSADNYDGHTAGDGIRISNVSLNVLLSTNTVTNAADDGIQVKFVAGAVNILTNRIATVGSVSATGDGIDVTQVAGNTTITGNIISAVLGDGTADPDGSVPGLSAGDGIRVELGTNELVITGNSIQNVGDDGIQVDRIPQNVTVSGNVIDDFGNLTGGAGDGIVIAVITGNVVASGNSVSNGNGTAADLDDPTQAAGDAIRIVETSGSVDASDNSVANVADNGIEVSQTGGDVNANGNALTGVANVAISIVATTGHVTASSNTLTSNGTGDAGDIGILLTDFASAVVTSNTIVNVSPGSLNIGIDIGNSAGPAVLITIAGNSISDSNTGLFIRDNVMGSVTSNTFTNNVVWGVQIDNTVSGNAIGQGFPGDPAPTIDIWFRDNFLSGNGAPVPGDGIARGGINNLNPGPGAGGFIFDARGNDFNGQVPFTTGTHFESPNSGGSGDAVSDWVRIEIPRLAAAVLVTPYYSFGSLLDNFMRGGNAETPGDVLALGPYFDQNGNLFDPYFVNVFMTSFSLAGDPTQATDEATQYGMCYLANMWRATSCRKAPGN